MPKESEIKDIQITLKLISRFIKKEPYILPVVLRKKITVIHYFSEIIRFWNKLNFIVKKVVRGTNSIESDRIPEYLFATYRILWEHASPKEIVKELKYIDKKFLNGVRTFSWNKALIKKDEKEKFSILEAIPSFMIDCLLPVMSLDFLRANIKLMNGLGTNTEITIRFNKLYDILSTEQIIDSLKKEKISYRKDPDLPELIWVPSSQKNKLIRNPLYKKGYLIFQDKASATVVYTLSPQENDKICDMCAAPGIKTSLIAQYMNNKGHILAGEFLLERVNTMNSLLNQLNVLNGHIINTDSITFPIRFQSYFDKVLLDAPCTGSGTFLTNPELKWRQNENFLHQNTILQKKLLKSALEILKPGGTLVYSTCSLYPQEGEYQILDILNQLEPLSLPKWFSPSYIVNNDSIPGTGRLFPSIHQTQGFFIGKFKKRG